MTPPPTSIGPYRIERELGRGGMGVVYLARDEQLGRSVAVKAIGDVGCADRDGASVEAAARFEREARTLASLSHPNIAAIYGVERAADERGQSRMFLVLEYVEGETLAERLKAGPLAVDDALDVCSQIAAGVEAAHDAGVIHRDLKPGNVKITPAPQGRVKVLDFGLARRDVGAPTSLSRTLPTDTPTASHVANGAASGPMTLPGVVLGTAPYMSPEQARGRPLDRRSDIWSFACVLFECLTGRAPFEGESATDVIAAILEREPDWAQLPERTPWRVRELLRRCLEKDPRRRLKDIGDARLELERSISGREWTTTGAMAAAGPARGGWLHSRATWWRIGFACGAIAAGLMAWRVWNPPATTSRKPVRVSIVLPPDRVIPSGKSRPVAISRDGRVIVYQGTDDKGQLALYRRGLGSLTVEKLPGTENGFDPQISPDGQWLMFVNNEDRRLRKMPVAGGPAVVLSDAPTLTGACWGDDGFIYFSALDVTKSIPEASGIVRISAAGATAGRSPETVTRSSTDSSDKHHYFPELLPGGRALIFCTVGSVGRLTTNSRLEVQNLATGTRRTLLTNVSRAVYASSGHLVYLRGSSLVAAPFDVERLEFTGPEVAVVERVRQSYETGSANFSMSADGTLVYVPGWGLEEQQRRLLHVDARGAARPLSETKGSYGRVKLSPDGQRLALVKADGEANTSIWVLDMARDSLTRTTFGPADDNPVWMPDGREIVYRSGRDLGETCTISRVPADGGGTSRPVFRAGARAAPESVSADGSSILLFLEDSNRNSDLAEVSASPPLPGTLEAVSPKVLVQSPFDEDWPRVSPDGRWMAYGSTESGEWEIYLRSYPGMTDKLRVSNSGGVDPRWSPDGTRIYFQNDGELFAVDITPRTPGGSPAAPSDTGNDALVGVELSPPVRLLNWPYERFEIGARRDEFIAVKNDDEQMGAAEIVVVQNWFEELKTLAPGAGGRRR